MKSFPRIILRYLLTVAVLEGFLLGFGRIADTELEYFFTYILPVSLPVVLLIGAVFAHFPFASGRSREGAASPILVFLLTAGALLLSLEYLDYRQAAEHQNAPEPAAQPADPEPVIRWTGPESFVYSLPGEGEYRRHRFRISEEGLEQAGTPAPSEPELSGPGSSSQATATGGMRVLFPEPVLRIGEDAAFLGSLVFRYQENPLQAETLFMLITIALFAASLHLLSRISKWPLFNLILAVLLVRYIPAFERLIQGTGFRDQLQDILSIDLEGTLTLLLAGTAAILFLVIDIASAGREARTDRSGPNTPARTSYGNRRGSQEPRKPTGRRQNTNGEYGGSEADLQAFRTR
ncbi:MAG: hypothetical protein K9L68_03935 [Spirochaetales bacterium]|nr:hypothetical protein [Spirochaetales bacterium]MCF7937729.1 hypothetical protein [Spirochaetales bacterium]